MTLAVEVKNKLRADPQWAAEWRRNIFAHGTYPHAPFFLMVFPDQAFLWTRSNEHLDAVRPDYVIDARPILQPFFDRAGVSPASISSGSLELIVDAWLSDLIHSDQPPDQLPDALRWLVESGLLEAIRGGRLEHEVAA
jgi:hypothetical protein